MSDSRIYRQESWLREKYEKEGLTTTEMAEATDVTSGTISYWMDKYGIERDQSPRTRKSTKERFFEKVQAPSPEECWEWVGALGKKGYGNFWNGERYESAHRVSYRIEYGDIDGKNVLHHCDNRSCVNPNHLYTGSLKENAADRERRNPWDRSGENAGRAKLARDEVDEIRNRLGSETQESLAEEFDVSRSAISHIAIGLNWGGE